jgi:hydrogenase maturation protein HypF
MCLAIPARIVELQADRAIVDAKFHNTLAEALLATAKVAREKTHLETAALSGGVFCNRYLVNRLAMRLKQEGFAVLLNCDVPSNDGGIALGQAAIAAFRTGEASSVAIKGG